MNEIKLTGPVLDYFKQDHIRSRDLKFSTFELAKLGNNEHHN